MKKANDFWKGKRGLWKKGFVSLVLQGFVASPAKQAAGFSWFFMDILILLLILLLIFDIKNKALNIEFANQ